MEEYRASGKEVLAQLKSTEQGLHEHEASERLTKNGLNAVTTERKTTFARLLLNQLHSYIIWLLIVIAAFAFTTGIALKLDEQLVNAAIITFIIIFNAFIGAYQDYKAEKAAELLRTLLATKARIVRGGVERVIDAQYLVAGDIVLLEEGERVPADCRLLNVQDLYVNESALTGESAEVEKQTASLKGQLSLAERTNMVYMHSFVVRGSAKAVVIATGKNTEIGRIASHLDSEKPSPFVQEVDSAAKTITYVALILIALVSLFLFLRGFSWISIFMIASALIIGSIPEGLPAIVTFSLASTTANLAKKNVLVKRKSLLETLGSIDVLCTDKTGTLTTNQMAVVKLYIDGAIYDPAKLPQKSKTVAAFHAAALLANEAQLTDKGFTGVAEDLALIDLCNDHGIDIIACKQNYRVTKLEPFSSQNKRTVAYVRKGKTALSYSKGAPEIILQACSHVLEAGKRKKLTKRKRQQLMRALDGFSDKGLRVLAFAVTQVKKKPQKGTLIALAGLHDPPRPEMRTVIAELYAAGIDVKMLTGDNERTARAIAEECGLRNVKAIGWQELSDMSETQLKQAALTYNVFARVSPEQKLAIVSSLQASGKRVAITGDGVNDAPALSRAEVGVVMGLRGADIAKEAGDIILLDDKLEHLLEAVQAGRTVLANVRKVLNYLLTTNLAEVFVVFIAALFSAVPFTAVQLLWVNFVTDVAPAMGLGVDPPHKGLMRKKPSGAKETIITKRLIWLTVLVGITKVALLLAVFFGTLAFTHNLVLAQTMAFTWLVLTHLIRLAAIRFDEKMPLLSNSFVNWAVSVPMVLQLLILYTPLAALFAVQALGYSSWLILLGLIAVSVVLAKSITALLDVIAPRGEQEY